MQSEANNREWHAMLSLWTGYRHSDCRIGWSHNVVGVVEVMVWVRQTQFVSQFSFIPLSQSTVASCRSQEVEVNLGSGCKALRLIGSVDNPV